MTRTEAKAFIESFVKLRNLVTDEMSLQVSNLYPAWKENTVYSVGNRVLYNEILYKVLQVHTSQADWTPEVAPSLFAKVLIIDENAVSEWEQPESTNPYNTGDKVTYNGRTYVSIIDNNIWAPDVYGWHEVVE